MRKTCRFLERLILVILLELFFVAVLGVISFSFMHDSQTNTLVMPHFVTIVFLLMILGTIGTGIFMALKPKKLCVTSIKKSEPFLLFAAAFAAIMMLVLFIYEAIINILKGQINAYFFFRAAKWVFSFVTAFYFIVQSLPKKLGPFKIRIPSTLKIAISICAIVWAIFGVLTVYFNALLINDISKISQLLVYASIAVFFVFEGEFENVKARHKPYMISAFICATLTFAFPLGISIAKILDKYSAYGAFSQPELILSFAIGLYALARMIAMIRTMRIVVDGSSDGHAKKFDKKPEKKSESAPKESEKAPESEIAQSEGVNDKK